MAKTTFLVCRVVGWMAGLIGNINNSAPNWVWLGLGLSLAITHLLKKQLHKQGLILDVTPAEVRLSENLPNQCQDTTSCGCRGESRDIKVFAAVQRTSNLTTSGKTFEDAGLIIGKSHSLNTSISHNNFSEAIIDAELGASGNIRAKGSHRDLKDIKQRKKRRPRFGKRKKKKERKGKERKG